MKRETVNSRQKAMQQIENYANMPNIKPLLIFPQGICNCVCVCVCLSIVLYVHMTFCVLFGFLFFLKKIATTSQIGTITKFKLGAFAAKQVKIKSIVLCLFCVCVCLFLFVIFGVPSECKVSVTGRFLLFRIFAIFFDMQFVAWMTM